MLLTQKLTRQASKTLCNWRRRQYLPYQNPITAMADHDLVEAAAVELEDLRRGPLRSSMLSSASPSPPKAVPPAASASFDSADSTASPSSPEVSSSSSGSPTGARRSSDGCYGDGSSHGINYRRANTVAVATSADTTAHSSSGASQGSCPGRRFPSNCLRLVRSLPGNSRCVDCEEMNPEWASVSYGVLLCLRCSGRHRGLGVNNSVVKSIAMDGWSHPQIISMLEGGNDQLSGFFLRHSLSPKSATTTMGSNSTGSGSGNSSGDEQDSDIIVAKAAAAAAKAAAALQANQKPKAPSRSNSFNTVDEIVALRYKTKAALFYRKNLAKHVERVAADGRYKGREAARKRATGSSMQ